MELINDPEPKSKLKTPKFHPMIHYKEILSKKLDPEIFKPNPMRLIGYSFCLAISLISFYSILKINLNWPIKALLGLLIGYCNGLVALICHEIAHGSVVRNKKLQDFLFFVGVSPFLISPTFWRFWHNRLHHGKTQQLIKDPDAFPNLRIFKASKFAQFMFPYTPGSGHKRSCLYFLFWFSFHNFIAQVYLRFRNEVFNTLDNRRVTLEFSAQVVMMIAMLTYAGPSNWIWVFVLPLFAQNYLVMSYVATNHNLSPLTSENDPLANSVSVTNNRLLEFLSVNFGYHVEHHLYATINGAKIKAVHFELLKNFPEQYKVLPKWQAIKALYSSPRIYKNSNELVHPETLKTVSINTLY